MEQENQKPIAVMGLRFRVGTLMAVFLAIGIGLLWTLEHWQKSAQIQNLEEEVQRRNDGLAVERFFRKQAKAGISDR